MSDLGRVVNLGDIGELHDDTIDALAYAVKFANPPMAAGQDKEGKWYKKKPRAKDWVVA